MSANSPDRFFLDTNIFVYSVTSDDPAKAKTATELLRNSLATHKGVVSYQVVQEFFNLALKRFEIRMSHVDREDYLERVFQPMLKVHSSMGIYSEALRLHVANKVSWYDSLIICAAREAGCGILYSEDLQHGKRFGSLRVVNPFL
jgi:predicted nucleic acid-binding protein